MTPSNLTNAILDLEKVLTPAEISERYVYNEKSMRFGKVSERFFVNTNRKDYLILWKKDYLLQSP